MLVSRTISRLGLEAACSTSYLKIPYQQKRNHSQLPPVIDSFFQYAADCNITTGLQSVMEVIHSTGFSWGATFIASGFVLRLVTSPFHIYAEKLFAKRVHATNFIHHAVLKKVGDYHGMKVVPNVEGNKLTLATKDEYILSKAESLANETINKHLMENRLQSSRIQNLKMVSVPVWIFSSFAIRNIVGGDFSPAIPGALWVPDLMLPDPYLALPAMVGLFGFLNLFSQRFIYSVKPTKWQQVYDVVLGVMTVVAIRIMMDLPACIPLYWLAVSTSGMAQSMLIRHPRFKSLFGIPRLPTDSRTPVRDLILMRRPQV